jgi:hypothetical protein
MELKTTLFRILTTPYSADEGTATCPSWFPYIEDLTVEENLGKFFCHNLWHSRDWRKLDIIKDIYIQIAPLKSTCWKTFRRNEAKLALCCSFNSQTQSIVSRRTYWSRPGKEFWECWNAAKGITILVSTPYMDEAACDRNCFNPKRFYLLEVDSPQNIIQIW